jgi:spoIIIJ-associated protein
VSEWIEVTASTVDAAKERALDLLGVAAEDAEFELIADASRQMFGLRRTDARIRARVRPTRPRPKQERARGQRRDRKGATQSGSSSRRSGRSGSRSSQAARSGQAAAGERTGTAGPAVEVVDRDANEDGDRRAGGDGKRLVAGQSAKNPSREQEDAVNSEQVPMTAQAEEVGAFLEGLLEAFDLEGEVEIGEIEDDTVAIDIRGRELGLLIGPRGQTMTALHELTKTVLQRSGGTGPRVRVRLDVAGYRQRRKEALSQFVRAQAAEVTASGTARALEPMNAADRKVVHDTCNELPGVATVSDGDEPRRRVIIVPAD